MRLTLKAAQCLPLTSAHHFSNAARICHYCRKEGRWDGLCVCSSRWSLCSDTKLLLFAVHIHLASGQKQYRVQILYYTSLKWCYLHSFLEKFIDICATACIQSRYCALEQFAQCFAVPRHSSFNHQEELGFHSSITLGYNVITVALVL